MAKPPALEIYATDPVAFIDDCVTLNERGQPFHLEPWQRELLRLAFAFDAEGRLAWDTLVLAMLKKSGKSMLNALLSIWWMYTQEAPNELYCFASDLEQAGARVFAMMLRIIKQNARLRASATTLDLKQIVLSNGTTDRPMAADAEGAAGSNQGLTSWDELWAYVSARSLRLWEEMTPVPTRRNSIRLVTTYAGILRESQVLEQLYTQGVGPAEHPEGQGVQIHPTLPLYFNAELRTLVFWDHVPRMPWQTPAYYRAQKRSLRPSTYARFHENRWVAAESVFITPELWDGCVDLAHRPLLPTRDVRLLVGVDAATKSDLAAVVGVYYDDNRLAVAVHRCWRPRPGDPIDLEATIEAYLRELYAGYALERILYDPYQLARSMKTLADAGLPVEEFPQTIGNTTKMGMALFEALKGRTLRVYPSDELREQAVHTVAVDSAQGFRLAKERTSTKVDAIVALSMALHAAIRGGRPVAAADVGADILGPPGLRPGLEREPAAPRGRLFPDLDLATATTDRGAPTDPEWVENQRRFHPRRDRGTGFFGNR